MTDHSEGVDNKAILCNTESPVDTESESTAHKLFKTNNDTSTNIPDYSDKDTQSYHCVKTKNNDSNQVGCKNETIDNIIKKLDMKELETSDMTNQKEYITKSKLTTLLGEVRVDILSLVNIVDMLNKNVKQENEEITKIKSDICKLVTENNLLKERLSLLKEKSGTQTSQQTQGQETEHNNRELKLTKNITKQNDIIETNIFTDSQMGSRATRFKIVPNRTKRNTSDQFGSTIQNKEEQQMPSRQAMRREITTIDINTNKQKSTNNLIENKVAIIRR